MAAVRSGHYPFSMKRSPARNSFPRARKIEGRLRDLIGQMRREVEKIIEPKAQALLETSAEVLGGLVRSFDDYRERREAAWQQEKQRTVRPRRSRRTAHR